MDKNFWLKRWTDQEIGWHRLEVNEYLKKYETLTGDPKGALFFPLCGKSVDLLWAYQKSRQVVGVELSPLATESFFREAQLSFNIQKIDRFTRYATYDEKLEIYCGDFFDLTPAQLSRVNGVFDRAALFALPSELRKKYVMHLTKLLPQNHSILLHALEHGGEGGPPFSVPEAEVLALYGNKYRVKKLEERMYTAEQMGPRSQTMTYIKEVIYHLEKVKE